MTYEVSFHKAAAKEFAQLERSVQKRVAKAIDALRSDPYPQNAETLKGSASARRIRVGSHRVVYEVYVDRVLVFVVAFGHRREIYDIVERRLK